MAGSKRTPKDDRRVWTPEEQESIDRTVRNLAAGLMAAPLVAPVKGDTAEQDADDE